MLGEEGRRRYRLPSMARCYRRLASEVCDLVEELARAAEFACIIGASHSPMA